jgi:hypothetical protein
MAFRAEITRITSSPFSSLQVWATISKTAPSIRPKVCQRSSPSTTRSCTLSENRSSKYRNGSLKTDFVLGQIAPVLFLVPLESHLPTVTILYIQNSRYNNAAEIKLTGIRLEWGSVDRRLPVPQNPGAEVEGAAKSGSVNRYEVRLFRSFCENL